MDIPDNSNAAIDLGGVKGNSITIGKNSKVSLAGEIENDRKLEIIVGEDSELRSCIIQKNGSFEQLNTAKANAKIYSALVYFGEGDVKIVNELEGDNSEAYDVEIFALNGSKKLAVDTRLVHIGKNTSGNILVKGIARDSAMARVDGMIKIEKSGAGANSFLDEHVMLLNAGARAVTNPQLEIENNDVSSRHAASVSQIDENKIFYMQARGIMRDDAKRLIVEGFLGAAVDKIQNAGAKEKVFRLISESI